MSVVTLQQVKDELRIAAADTDQDTHLQLLLDAAESEALSYTNASALPQDPAVISAVLLLVRSKFDLDDARDMVRYRTVAESLLQPHRVEMGF